MKLRQRKNSGPLLPRHSQDDVPRRRKRRPRRQRQNNTSVFVCITFVLLLAVWIVYEDLPAPPVVHVARVAAKHKVAQWWKGREKYQRMNCGDDDNAATAYRNDNYCDCRKQGADEPGTAACADVTVGQRTFDCGDGSTFVFASRVGDGVRDCPNGRDEMV